MKGGQTMQYLAYHEYTGIGGTLDPTAFNRHIHRACGIIDNATHKRIEKMSSVPEQAKALCRELVDYLATHNVTDKTIASCNRVGYTNKFLQIF